MVSPQYGQTISIRSGYSSGAPAGVPRCPQCGTREGRPRTCQEKALDQRHAQGGDDTKLLLRLDPLADGAHSFSTAVLEDVLDQPRGPPAFLDPADHRHVQLHEVGLEQRQAVEARVTGAEIVD